MSNISVTGNEAQFNENVTFLKDVDIRGSLTVPEINSSSLSITGIATFTSQVTFNQGLSFPDLEVRDFLKVGIGTGGLAPDGLLHVMSVNAGSVTSDPSANLLTLENSSDAGLSILSGNNASGNIFFGDVDDNDVGQIVYDHSSNFMSFFANGSEKILMSIFINFLIKIYKMLR